MALTNTLVNNVCYPSVQAASDAYFSSLPVSFVTSSTDTYRVFFIKSGADWLHIKSMWNSAGSSSTLYSFVASAPSFPACDVTEPFFDGMQMGWGIVAAMVAVSAVILIRRAFF